MKKLINFIAIVTIIMTSCLSFAMDMDTKPDSRKRKAVAAAYQSKAKRSKKSFKCTQCNKAFDKKYHLERHMIIHTDEKPFKCSQCERAFSDKSNLTQHIHTHTGEKPKKKSSKKTFNCSECDKTFAYERNLTQHMRIHTGEKPRKKSSKKTLFNCPKCDKPFSHRGVLNRHMRTHTGETSFKCSTCDKTFKSKHGLAGHGYACERKPLASIKATATLAPSILSQRESSTEVPVAAIVVSRKPSSSDTQSSSTRARMQPIAIAAALVPAKEITLPVQDDWEIPRKDSTHMDIQ